MAHPLPTGFLHVRTPPFPEGDHGARPIGYEELVGVVYPRRKQFFGLSGSSGRWDSTMPMQASTQYPVGQTVDGSSTYQGFPLDHDLTYPGIMDRYVSSGTSWTHSLIAAASLGGTAAATLTVMFASTMAWGMGGGSSTVHNGHVDALGAINRVGLAGRILTYLHPLVPWMFAGNSPGPDRLIRFTCQGAQLMVARGAAFTTMPLVGGWRLVLYAWAEDSDGNAYVDPVSHYVRIVKYSSDVHEVATSLGSGGNFEIFWPDADVTHATRSVAPTSLLADQEVSIVMRVPAEFLTMGTQLRVLPLWQWYIYSPTGSAVAGTPLHVTLVPPSEVYTADASGADREVSSVVNVTRLESWPARMANEVPTPPPEVGPSVEGPFLVEEVVA